jgi:hypothetical protein
MLLLPSILYPDCFKPPGDSPGCIGLCAAANNDITVFFCVTKLEGPNALQEIIENEGLSNRTKLKQRGLFK